MAVPPNFVDLARKQRLATNNRLSFNSVVNGGAPASRDVVVPVSPVQYGVDISCNEFTQTAYLTYFSTTGKTIPGGDPTGRAYATYDIPGQAPDTHAMVLWGQPGDVVWWVGWSYTGDSENLYVKQPAVENITMQPPVKTAGSAQGWEIADTRYNPNTLVITPFTF